MNYGSTSTELKYYLPSAHQNNDVVKLALGKVEIHNCIVMKVHFSESKVCYDLAVPIESDKSLYRTRIYNVDSAFVTKQ